jgi:hypothetical protein
MKLAAANPTLREAVMHLVSGVKYNRLLTGLETLFPQDKAQQLLQDFWPGSSVPDAMWDEVLDNFKVVKWDVVATEEGEHVEVMDPWGGGNSPDAEEHYYEYKYPSEVSVQVQAHITAPELAKIVAIQGRGRPDAKQLLEFLRDKAVADTMAQILQKEANDWLNNTRDGWYEDTIWDGLMDEIQTEIDSDPIEVDLKFDKAVGQAQAVPDGRGGVKLTLHTKMYLLGEGEPGDDMPTLRMPPKHHGYGRV